MTPKVDKWLVIRVDDAGVAVNVGTKLHTQGKDGQKLLIPCTVVTLSGKVLVRVITHRVVTIIIRLQQNPTNSLVAGIGLHNK